ncbi:helix-turn-helix transcriptional regulator [Streptomyces sp. NRRL WC-3725]|uniref:helix-turn-helix transcriptional regulator n=1 Tax=Streptomyces sp. NRRL WC-3725 TaxID=1463933 RepID=UPI0004CB5926|nr:MULTISPECIES: helix-turn-helix domain-containing protein [Streptomyces]KMS92544.1 ArsR family transcriptional regulator [Streptomyces regensis]KOG70860.1 ArsR family transcriptional regulator [Streptomyces antibioticus]
MTTRESPRRREVLDVLRTAPAPLGVAEAAERMGLHPNTVRFHLDALVADGLVERRTVAPTGPGRPRTVHTVRPGMDRGGHRDYRLLARMLLSRWAAADPAEARAEAKETGRAWGRFLVDPLPPYEPATSERSVAALLDLLDGLGFAPQPEGEGAANAESGRTPERIRLRHCPFLELAEEQGGLVCPLHLGLMQGALAELGASLTATALEPFAEPDSCVAHLAGTAPG